MQKKFSKKFYKIGKKNFIKYFSNSEKNFNLKIISKKIFFKSKKKLFKNY